MMFPAEIRTDRLVLRPPVLRDCRFFVRLLGNTDTRRYLGGPVPWRHAVRRFRDYLSLPDGVAAWIVCRSGDDVPLGLVELSPHKDGTDYEVSYQFDPAIWGKGFAHEAVGAVLDHVLHGDGLERVIAETQSANTASCRLLERLGMTEVARLQRFGAEQVIYRSAAKPEM
ncbi:GNAT family N-acetyltransferase [Tateyamaria omphalii]|uniref:GNAT family N-acetyltransferase n=1 Tax=Tateyamaria omphalii TaxID=299262 RepID=UPI001C99ED60|nr:GNAT family N-acetyltransferase [Tateyamaria omphalii]MBY5934011.1 GNAT family N-acetyltransferase [Tateyamaria omphalii]